MRTATIVAVAVFALVGLVGKCQAQQSPVVLSEVFREGTLYEIKSRGQLEGTLRPPAETGKPAPAPIKIEGGSAMEYAERVLEVGPDNLVVKTLRLCQKMEVKRTMAGQEQQNALRPVVRRLVVLRDRLAKAPFSPDGPLLWTEIDLVRTDVLFPLLVGLFPDRPVGVGAQWQAADTAVQELTGLEKIKKGGLTCSLSSIQVRGGQQVARVDFRGTVEGTNEDGSSQQEITGHYLFDVNARLLTFLLINGKHALVGPDGKEAGSIQGRFALERKAVESVSGIGPGDVARDDTIPGPTNTQLLFDNAELGVKFLYSRRWRLAGVKGRQITLDTPEGHGLLITLEPEKNLPTAAAYQRESREWVEKQGGRVTSAPEPRGVAGVANLEHFNLGVELGGQPGRIDYYVLRQPGSGGALLAVRLMADQADARAEAEKIARTLTIGKRIE